MAAVFDLNTEFRSRAVAAVDVGLDSIEIAVSTLDALDAVTQIQRAQRRLAGLETRILAEHVSADGNTREAEKLLNDSKASSATKNKKLGRAKVVGKNPTLADKLADDDIGEEQLDLLAEASNKSDGAAATDETLINNIAAANPDAGRAIKDDWLAARATANGTQTAHDLQRAKRRTTKYTCKDSGLDVTGLKGDGITQRAIHEAIRARSREILKRDSANDKTKHDHRRTRNQRNYDAAYELICGVTTHPNGSHTPNTKTTTDKASSNSTASSGARPALVVGITIDQTVGTDPAHVARQIGLGVIPQSVLANYAEQADIFAAIYDRNGDPLWLARLRRHATTTQYIALVLRDKGCVQCNAPPTECDAHHRMPWHAPNKGPTDLDNLVLLCKNCHTRLHAAELTIYRDPTSRQWLTRPATPNELPPPQATHPPPQRE